MKLGIVAHPERPEAADLEHILLSESAAHGIEITEPEAADVVVSIGGDGTLLRAIRATSFEVPVVGIDIGHVGYLAEVEPTDAATLVTALANGAFDVVERMTVTVEMPDGDVITGLNDVVVEKVASQHAVRLNCTIDGDHLVTYRADGVIVATPTGSTAYAYSAGGPVIDPGVSALIIVPVAPHNLFSRPVVVGPDSVIELEVLAGRSVRVNVDGHECGEVGDGLTLRLRRGDRPARLVSFLDGGFASRVASNLGIPGE